MIADSAEIKFACSQCGQSLLVDASGAGLTAICPTCENPITVPQPGAIHDRSYGSAAEKRRRGISPARSHLPGVDVDALRAELTEAQQASSRLETELADAQAESAQLQRQLDATVADAASRINAAQLQLGEAMQRIRELDAARDDAEQGRVKLEGELARSTELAFSRGAEVSQRDAELAEVRARLAQTDGERCAALEENRGLRVEIGRLQAQLDAAQGVREAKAQIEQELIATSGKLTGSEERCRALESTGANLRTEIETLRHDLSGTQNGRDLVELRSTLKTTEAERQRIASALSRVQADAATLTASEQKLRADLSDTQRRCAEAEHLAESRAESQLKQDNDTLRGIIARQNVVIEERFAELRRLKRIRLFARILYSLVGLGLIGLIAYAVRTLPPALRSGLPDWLSF
jgi:chromosome segregation ATPase